ncbi:hypothetical protein RBB79_10515 [Tunturiibacter empetritectus]|uniref:Uncharacterized protein n=1 Tax=Tunturiibacter lichenicola TaxID=2051959 RepID=A0A852VII4_9BACT|nr:hypothetical protein [Edaphobacter lichenicola]NYF89995.1 hypothetical protein [Edaphobacter lichenicola]
MAVKVFRFFPAHNGLSLREALLLYAFRLKAAQEGELPSANPIHPPQNKSGFGGVFFGSEIIAANDHVQTTIPPRLHQQKTTTKHMFFPKHPSKLQQKQQSPGSHQGPTFFETTS